MSAQAVAKTTESAKKRGGGGSPTWYTGVIPLAKAQRASKHPIVIASDIVCDSGRKKYAPLPSFQAMMEFLHDESHGPNHYYELLHFTCSTDKPAPATYAYFDIDRVVAEGELQVDGARILNAVVGLLLRFWKEVYHIDHNFTMGKDYQVAVSPNSRKVSYHIKFNIVVPTNQAHKILVANLVTFILEQIGVGHAHYHDLFYEKERKTRAGQTEPIHASSIDQSVYTRTQAFRILRNTKMGKADETALVPFGSSSAAIEDHLVQVYDGNPQTVVFTLPACLPASESPVYAPSNKTALSVIRDLTTYRKRVKPTLASQQTIEEAVRRARDLEKFGEMQGPLETAAPTTDRLDKIKEFIEASSAIERTIGAVKIRKYQHNHGNVYHFYISACEACPCKYAGRVHRNNRQFFEYRHPENLLHYKCFDDECISVWKDGGWVFSFGDLTKVCKEPLPTSCGTLHCMQDNIKWDERYNSEDMRPYPLTEICCVRAGMGLGKTKALSALIDDQEDHATMLVITYSQTLAKNMYGALEGFGFVNYLDVRGPLSEPRLIVCLDSLCRLTQDSRRVDFVFLDEALSVLNHFNSTMMERKAEVSMLFESILMGARHLYALDACVDNTIMVFECIQHISKKKNVRPYWIWNDYIRPTNVKATIHEVAVAPDAKEFARTLLKDFYKGKRSVVVSSTKAFTVKLESALRSLCRKRVPRILVFNSDTDKEELTRHAENVDAEWTQVDILTYSPTISAGISFEKPHFHNLYGFLWNNPKTPSVDLMAQMLKRVRVLIEGNMEL